LLDRGGSPAGVVEGLVRYEGGGPAGVVDGAWEKREALPLRFGVAGEWPKLRLILGAMAACCAVWASMLRLKMFCSMFVTSKVELRA